jgi:hypothetical protein
MTITRTTQIAAYTTGILRARDAYRRDMAVEMGLCSVCERRRINGAIRRKCWGCSGRRTAE